MGLYLNCPRCGLWLPPTAVPEGQKLQIPSEPFLLVKFGDSWQYATEKTLEESSDEN